MGDIKSALEDIERRTAEPFVSSVDSQRAGV